MNRAQILAQYRQRIQKGERIKLTTLERAALVQDFVARLRFLNTPQAIRQLCQDEIALLEEGYGRGSNSTTNYLSNYRTAIAEAVKQGQLTLTHNTIVRFTEQKQATGEPIEAVNHLAWSLMRYDNAVYSANRRVANRDDRAKPDRAKPDRAKPDPAKPDRSFRPEQFLKQAAELLQAEEAETLAVGITAVTGRRYTEVAISGQFSLSQHPYLLSFDGQLHPDAPVSYPILSLLPARDVIEAIQRFRSLPAVQKLQGLSSEAPLVKNFRNRLNSRIKRHFQKTKILPVLPGESVSPEDLRTAYGCMAVYFWLPNQGVDQQRFRQFYFSFLEAAPMLDAASTAPLPGYRLVDKSGKVITASGIKLMNNPPLPKPSPAQLEQQALFDQRLQGHDQVDLSQIELSRVEPSRVELSRVEPSRVELSRVNPSNNMLDETKEHRLESLPAAPEADLLLPSSDVFEAIALQLEMLPNKQPNKQSSKQPGEQSSEQSGKQSGKQSSEQPGKQPRQMQLPVALELELDPQKPDLQKPDLQKPDLQKPEPQEPGVQEQSPEFLSRLPMTKVSMLKPAPQPRLKQISVDVELLSDAAEQLGLQLAKGKGKGYQALLNQLLQQILDGDSGEAMQAARPAKTDTKTDAKAAIVEPDSFPALLTTFSQEIATLREQIQAAQVHQQPITLLANEVTLLRAELYQTQQERNALQQQLDSLQPVHQERDQLRSQLQIVQSRLDQFLSLAQSVPQLQSAPPQPAPPQSALPAIAPADPEPLAAPAQLVDPQVAAPEPLAVSQPPVPPNPGRKSSTGRRSADERIQMAIDALIQYNESCLNPKDRWFISVNAIADMSGTNPAAKVKPWLQERPELFQKLQRHNQQMETTKPHHNRGRDKAELKAIFAKFSLTAS